MFRLRQDRSTLLLAIFLLVAVLAPSGAVLWFMNETARGESDAARQRVTEAYRGQLRLLRDRVTEWWRSRRAALDGAPSFLPALKASGADSVVLLDERARPSYPSLPAPPARFQLINGAMLQAETAEQLKRFAEAEAAWRKMAVSARDDNTEALAAQGAIRCLLRAQRRDAALAAIEQYFGANRLSGAHDADGRLITADEQLLALHLLKRGDPRFPALAQHLAARLNDYGPPLMPSAQRLFLMGELRSLAGESVNLSTSAAELLAEQFVETERVRPGGASLKSCSLGDVWKLTSPDGRTVALYRTSTVVSLMDKLMRDQNSSVGVRFAIAPPGTSGLDETVAAGAMLPGWQISFALVGTSALETAGRRSTAYIWLACAVVGATVVMGLFAVRFFQRQARLNRLRTDLIAAVSHELKTPLASMRLLVETLLDDEHPDAAKTRDYLQLMAGENLRLTRLVENFLTFSRIERNRQRFEFAETRPADVVESALTAMGERLQAPECKVEVRCAPGLPTLHADRHALTTVLLNLLDNAWKYTPGEKLIRVRAYRQNGRVLFDVEDNGIGIAPREQKRIFRRFYQVDRRLAREAGGCGLGLSIVEFIVRAHGGEVTVESRPSAGSTFHVALPCGAAPSKEAVA